VPAIGGNNRTAKPTTAALDQREELNCEAWPSASYELQRYTNGWITLAHAAPAIGNSLSCVSRRHGVASGRFPEVTSSPIPFGELGSGRSHRPAHWHSGRHRMLAPDRHPALPGQRLGSDRTKRSDPRSRSVRLPRQHHPSAQSRIDQSSAGTAHGNNPAEVAVLRRPRDCRLQPSETEYLFYPDFRALLGFPSQCSNKADFTRPVGKRTTGR